MNRVTSYLAHVWAHAKIAAAYVYGRAFEASTWTGVVGAIGSAKELPAPLNYLGIAAGTVAVLVPRQGS